MQKQALQGQRVADRQTWTETAEDLAWLTATCQETPEPCIEGPYLGKIHELLLPQAEGQLP